MTQWLIYRCVANHTPYGDKILVGDAETIEGVRQFTEGYLTALYGQSDEIEHCEYPTFAQYRHPQSTEPQGRMDIIAGLVQEGEKLITSPSEFIHKVVKV